MSKAFDAYLVANFPSADRHLRGALRRVWDHMASGAGDDELFEKVLEMEKKMKEAAEAVTEGATNLAQANETIAAQEARIQELEGELADREAASEAEDTDNPDEPADPVSNEG